MTWKIIYPIPKDRICEIKQQRWPWRTAGIWEREKAWAGHNSPLLSDPARGWASPGQERNKKKPGKGQTLLNSALGWIMFPRCLRAATGKKQSDVTSILELDCELGKDGLYLGKHQEKPVLLKQRLSYLTLKKWWVPTPSAFSIPVLLAVPVLSKNLQVYCTNLEKKEEFLHIVNSI